MDPTKLIVAQLKDILGRHNLPTSGRKAELILRMQMKDPTESWVEQATRQDAVNDGDEDFRQMEDVDISEGQARTNETRADGGYLQRSVDHLLQKQRNRSFTKRERAYAKRKQPFKKREFVMSIPRNQCIINDIKNYEH